MTDIEITFTNVYDTLKQYSEEFDRRYKALLNSEGRTASGELEMEAHSTVRVKGTEYSVVLQAPDQAKYIEEGRKPASKFPPLSAIQQWMRDKNIVPQERNGKLPTEKQLAFLLGRAIANNGTIKDKNYQGGHYIKRVADELNAVYIPRLREALGKDWEEASIKVLRRINSMMRF